MEAGGGWCKPLLRWVLFIGGFVLSGLVEVDESEDPIAGGKLALFNKTNEQKLPRRGKTKLAG